MNQVKLTREELYQLVWSQSMVSLAKKFQISDNGLRKTCIRWNIPLPNAGHWVKLQFGKKVQKKPLPARLGGGNEIILVQRSENDTTDPALSALANRTEEIKKDKRLNLDTPAKLISPHNLIIEVRDALRSDKPGRQYNYIGVVFSRKAIDIRVSPQLINRALLFLDTLIKALIARGHEVSTRNDFAYAIVNGQDFKICIKEKMKKVVIKDGWDRTELHPTGMLTFTIDHFTIREWKDGKHPLEYYIPQIIAKLEIASDEINKEHERQRLHFEALREKERLAKAEIEKKVAELKRFKNLLKDSKRWNKANLLRQYIDAVENYSAANSQIGDIQDWLNWARKKADWYDPLINGKDDLLGMVDKNTLKF